MNEIELIFKMLGIGILVILLLNNLYLLVFSLAAYFTKSKDVNSRRNNHEKYFLVIFPAYKEDQVILDSVSNFLRQEYSSFHLYVIADQLQDETITALRKKRISVCVLPDSDKRNKANAINYLLNNLNEPYDACVIMDADNHVEDNFLREMNGYFLSGSKAVQAQRTAKNKSNDLSKLDGISENINNHIFRKGQRALGFSSSLIGSGMAFEMQLFKELMTEMNVFSGFDKELELRLLSREIKIKYAEDILVYDEKVSDHKVFINQRRRWIYAQFFFLKKNIFNALKALVIDRNADYANKVLQFILLPRSICIGSSILMLMITFIIGPIAIVAACVNLLMLSIALLLPLIKTYKTKDLFKLGLGFPRIFVNMIFAGATSGKASGKFLHTPHNSK